MLLKCPRCGDTKELAFKFTNYHSMDCDTGEVSDDYEQYTSYACRNCGSEYDSLVDLGLVEDVVPFEKPKGNHL